MNRQDHIILTRKAVQIFHRFRQNPISSEMLAFTDEIARGSKEADNATLERGRNWHFYNRWLQLPTGRPWFIYLLRFSPEHVLNKRFQQVELAIEAGNRKQLYLLIGRILHHIQDMSTPSHVVPVYHGIFIKDSYETYLSKCYLNNPAHVDTAGDEITEQVMSDLENIQIAHTLEIYQAAAKKTLAYLDPANSSFSTIVDNVPQQLPWNLFWKPNIKPFEPVAGRRLCLSDFGKFGLLGKHFGQTQPIRVDKSTYIIELEEYHRLCYHFTVQAITDSLLTLLFMEKRISPPVN